MKEVFIIGICMVIHLAFTSSDVMMKYHRYLKNPVEKNYASFDFSAYQYSLINPLKCFKLLERYHSDWTFKVLFLRSIGNDAPFILPSAINKNYYNLFLRWLLARKLKILHSLNGSNERKFLSNMETISLLVKITRKNYVEIKSKWGIDTVMHKNLEDRIAIWDFLVENISMDFDKKSVDYYSLSIIFNEIESILLSGNLNTLKFTKLCTLLWFYLFQIYIKDCTLIFEESHRHRAIFIYVIVRLWGNSYDHYQTEESYAEKIKICLKELYKGASLQLDPMKDFLKSYDAGGYYHRSLFPKKATSFTELSRFLEYEYFKRFSAYNIWKIRAFAQIEDLISRNSTKIKII